MAFVLRSGRARGAATFMLVLASLAVAGPSAAAQDGAELYVESCASCHGTNGEGTETGPSLVRAGAASADFYLRTGRMPLADPDAQTRRKDPAFTEGEIAALVAYIDELGSGPAIPEIDLTLAHLPTGQELFIDNCAPCHGATGNGGAVGPGALAPSLHLSSSLDIAEAVLIGPGQMPVFGLTDRELASILSFVDHLQTADPPGGADLGQIGPVPEGYIAWVVGGVGVVAMCIFIARPRRRQR